MLSPTPLWSDLFSVASQELLRALGGWAWDGGLVFGLEHVGATSISKLITRPCLDIAVSIHPFPLRQAIAERLEALGYTYEGEDTLYKQPKFSRKTAETCTELYLYEAGSKAFADAILFRDYLRANEKPRQHYEVAKLNLYESDGYAKHKAQLLRELTDEARAWHIRKTGFKPIAFIKEELKGVDVPWCIGSGWGLDLFLKEVGRFHHDLDICIWRKDQQPFLGHLQVKGWKIHVVSGEGKYRPWEEAEFLALPVSQVHARREDMPFELLDILFMEEAGDSWLYRRDPNVTMPKKDAVTKSATAPILNPAITVLFKSRTADQEPREKDRQDFERVLPALDLTQRQWLDKAFEIWLPDHPWHKRLV